MDNFITEDYIVNWIKKNNGILITRKHVNIMIKIYLNVKNILMLV